MPRGRITWIGSHIARKRSYNSRKLKTLKANANDWMKFERHQQQCFQMLHLSSVRDHSLSGLNGLRDLAALSARRLLWFISAGLSSCPTWPGPFRHPLHLPGIWLQQWYSYRRDCLVYTGQHYCCLRDPSWWCCWFKLQLVLSPVASLVDTPLLQLIRGVTQVPPSPSPAPLTPDIPHP